MDFMKVHTEAVQFKADQKLISFIEKKLAKMEQYFDRIIEARVILKLENSGQVRDKVAEVSLSVPGDTIFVKEINKTFEASIDSATDALKRQLIKYKEKIQRH
jgi:putative sigma-54 modulation protein